MSLDKELLASGATIERTLTLEELGKLLAEDPNLVVEVDTPEGDRGLQSSVGRRADRNSNK